MYDPSTFGTPLTLLQIPAQAIADVQSKLSEPNATIAHYTQDCQALSDLKHLVSSTDVAVAREATVDVGYICKKCHMVYPGRDACLAHQQQLCYQGKVLDPSKSILKLEQIQYKCGACKDKFSTLAEYKNHCALEPHRATASKYLAMKQAAKATSSSSSSTSRSATPSASVDSRVTLPGAVAAATVTDSKAATSSSAPPAPLPPPSPSISTQEGATGGNNNAPSSCSPTVVTPLTDPAPLQRLPETSSSQSPPVETSVAETAVSEAPLPEVLQPESSSPPLGLSAEEGTNVTPPANRNDEPEPMEQD